MSNYQAKMGSWWFQHMIKTGPLVDTNCVYLQNKSTNPYVYITSEAVIRYCESVMPRTKVLLMRQGMLTALDGRVKPGNDSSQLELVKTFAKMIGCELKYFPAKEFAESNTLHDFKPYLEDLKKLKSSE